MKRLFVRSGGGLLGLDIHLGIWKALNEAGIKSDGCIGTSAGAIISAIDASGVSEADTEVILRGLKSDDVKERVALWKLRLPFINHFLKHEPILTLLERLIFKDVKLYQKFCEVVAMRWDNFEEVRFNTNNTAIRDFRQCVLASMSIAGVFPRVEIDGVEYSDGGTRANIPVPETTMGYDEVWVLIATNNYMAYQGRDTILTALMRQVEAKFYDEVADVLERFSGLRNYFIVYPRLNIDTGSLNFSNNHEAIDRAYEQAKTQIRYYQG